MKLITSAEIMNKRNFEYKLYDMIKEIDICCDFVEKLNNNESKFEISLKKAREKYSLNVNEIINSILLDLKNELSWLDSEINIHINKSEYEEYAVSLSISFNIEEIIDLNIEKAIKSLKSNLKLKIKKDDNMYNLVACYGVYDNEWYLTAINESLDCPENENPMDTDGLKWRIEWQKEEMDSEDYSIEALKIFCIDTLEDYQTDLYYNKNLSDYTIDRCYIEGDNLIVKVS